MTTIITKNGSGAPTAGQLSEGELAVDLTNKELYTKSGSTVIKIGGTGGGETGTFTDLTATSSFTSPGIDDNATSTAITIDASENVGIGTATPSTSLDVVRAGVEPLRIQSTTSGTVQMRLANTAGNAFINGVGNDIVIPSGNVGIDSTAPARDLTIGGATAATTHLQLTNATSGTSTADGFQISQYTTGAVQLWNKENSYTALGTNNAERMRIDAAGNVGINETNPSSNLQVSSATGGNAYLSVARKNSNASAVRLAAENGLTFLFSTGDEPLALGANNTERMRITSSGDVGIGTASPDATLTVKPQSAAIGTHENQNWSYDSTNTGVEFDLKLKQVVSSGLVKYKFDLRNSGTSYDNNLVLDRGNVGIGTSAPVDQLDVKASGDDERLVRISHPSSPTAAAGYFGFTDTGLGANTGVALGVQYAGGYYDALTIDRETRNVGIGTTNPTAKMVVEVGNNEPASSGNMDTGMVVQSGNGSRAINMGGSNTGGYNWINSAYANNSSVAANLVLMTGAQERMRIDSSGNAVIGGNGNAYSSGSTTITPTGDISNSSASGVASTLNLAGIGGVSNGFQITTNTSNQHEYTFLNGAAVAMKLDTSGNLLVGTTTTIGTGTEGVQIAPNLIITGRNQTSDQTHHVFKNPNGTVGRIRTLNNATDYVTSSDERLKENIVDAPAGNIDSIKVRSFDWKADGEHQDYGFIAQELETVAPYAVSKGETENDMWGVDYSKLVPMLVKEIQDLKAEVAALKGA